MSERIREHILAQLQTLQKKKIRTDGAAVVCPFHNDSNPSGNVNLDVTGSKAPLGWFRCWSCPANYPWDKYAEAAGLKPIRRRGKKRSDDYLAPDRFKDELLESDLEGEGVEAEMKGLEFFEFQNEEWRSIPTKVLEKLGCKFCYYDFTGDFYVWMPVYIFGELKGFVKAEMEKPEDRTRPSYINAKGSWSAEFGLLFFDYSVKLMKKKGLRTIVLCEGPRDAIRLIRAGIPAMAVLGAVNWTDEKRFILEKIDGLDNVILMMDGDDAGIAATKKIFKNIKGHFSTKYMKLWKYRKPDLDEKGKQRYKKNKDGSKKLLWVNELDPFSAPRHLILKVKNALE